MTEGKSVNIALNLTLLIDTLGEWVVSVSFDEGEPHVELPFEVTLGQSPE